jgi:putative pyruvate formate lyase activating enzyme
MKLQDVGRVHNINLVIPEHVVPQVYGDYQKNKEYSLMCRQVVLNILHARKLGLRLAIIYNTFSFESLESIQLLNGLVDIYLPDFKVWSDKTSKR